MGLFIGASLLTILEILDYLCEVGHSPRHMGRTRPRVPREVGVGHLLLPLAPRFSKTESWGISGTEGALKGTLAVLW